MRSCTLCAIRADMVTHDAITAHFSLDEFMCDGERPPTPLWGNLRTLCARLEILRREIQAPIIITSGWRSPEHNHKVGGAPRSMHLWGAAADIQVRGLAPSRVMGVIEDLVRKQALPDGGVGLYAKHVHIDIGPKRRWSRL